MFQARQYASLTSGWSGTLCFAAMETWFLHQGSYLRSKNGMRDMSYSINNDDGSFADIILGVCNLVYSTVVCIKLLPLLSAP